jgi:hypothetical protein
VRRIATALRVAGTRGGITVGESRRGGDLQRESDDGPGRSNDTNAWKAPVLSVMAVQMEQSGGNTHAAGLRITSWPDGLGTDCVAHVASPPVVPASSHVRATHSLPASPVRTSPVFAHGDDFSYVLWDLALVHSASSGGRSACQLGRGRGRDGDQRRLILRICCRIWLAWWSRTLALITRAEWGLYLATSGYLNLAVDTPVPTGTDDNGEPPASTDRISLTLDENASQFTECYGPDLCTAGVDAVRRATRVPQEGVSDGQRGSLLTTAGRRLSRPG